MSPRDGGDDDITLGELGRNLNALRDEIGKLREAFTGYVVIGVYQAEQRLMEDKVTNLQAQTKAEIANVRADLEELKSSRDWLVRTIIALVIVTVMGAVGFGTTR